MADIRPRRRRLLALLPRIFAEQPAGSAVGALIEAMAAGLAELDESLNRTQRDHWVNLASGDSGGGQADALERLGMLLGIPQLEGEAVEDYRQRLKLTARVLMRGLTTPRALLELAIATLGAEPCPRQEANKDAVLGFGVPFGTMRRCPACQSGAPAPCPNAGKRVLEAWITDNPPQRRSYVADPPLKPGDRYFVESLSLVEDVPELRIKALGQPVRYPYVQNRATGEITFYAGVIQQGEVLSLWPQVESWEALRYDSHDPAGTHAWRNQYPSGSAVLIGLDGKPQSVSSKIYYLSGAMFESPNALEVPRFADPQASDGVRFADALSQGDAFDRGVKFAAEDDQQGAHFGSSGQRVRSPRLRPGLDEWSYGVYTQEDIKAVAGSQTGALYDNAPKQAGDAPVELALSWWVRPPATFRMRIPRNAWVGRAESRGAPAMLTQWVRQAKAAGVLAWVDFPEPILHESQALAEQVSLRTRQQWRESQPLEENVPRWNVQSRNQEIQTLGEGALIWRGVFDSTRLDGSRFDTLTPNPSPGGRGE